MFYQRQIQFLMKNLFFIFIILSDLFGLQKVESLLEEYCYTCHDEDVQKGNFQMDHLSLDISNGTDAEKWQLILDQLNLNEMPPEKKKQPSPQERLQLINHLTRELKIAREKKRNARQVVMRRLTKTQYTNALNDLLGLDIDFGKALPKERYSEDGFTNNGEAQIISLMQTEYYQSIAKEALTKTILDHNTTSYRYTYRFGRNIHQEKVEKEYKKKGSKENRLSNRDFICTTTTNDDISRNSSTYNKNNYDIRCYANLRGSDKKKFKVIQQGVQLYPSTPHKETYNGHVAFLSPSPNLQLQIKDFPTEGEFSLKIVIARSNPEQEHVYLRAFMGERLDWGTDSRMFDSVKVTGTLEQFQTIILKGRLENFPIPVLDPRHKDPNSTLVIGVINDSGFKSPEHSIIISEMELTTNPKSSWPREHVKLVMIDSKNKHDENIYSKEIIRHFMQRAFRKVPSNNEVENYHQLWKDLRPHCQSFDESIVDCLVAILNSPRFLYMAESIHDRKNNEITQSELASRLALFLWNSLPDQRLIHLAERKELNDHLHVEIDRMLNNRKSRQFIQSFTKEWLQIDKMTHVKIDAEQYSEFNKYIRQDMLKETELFFAEVLRNNLSIMNFIDSDFGILNHNLANYYGIPNVTGPSFRKVSIKSHPERGGLISNGIFLTGNSDGKTGNPIKRGVWMISRILDDAPPEPPPNVPGIDPADPDFLNLSIREQLKKHRQNESCYECHRKIDPWGLLFENYNAGGIWESKKLEEVTLSNGVKLNNALDLKEYLLQEKQEQFAYAMTKYLLRYALGRSLSYLDNPDIDQLVSQAKEDKYGLKSLIKSIVKSPLFSKM